MRTVTGPTDRVVVVGAGLAGLSAALRLAGAGREVTRPRARAVPGRPGGPARPPTAAGLPVRHRPDRADHAGPDRRRARLRRRASSRTGSTCCRSTRCTGRASPTDRRSTSTPTSRRWPPRSRRCAGRREADGYRRYVEFVSELYRARDARRSSTATSTRPLDLVSPDLARLAAIGGFRPAGAEGRSVPAGPAHRSGSSRSRRCTPGLSPVRRAGHLRRDRLHGLRRRRLLPARRDARRAGRAGRRSGEARRASSATAPR